MSITCVHLSFFCRCASTTCTTSKGWYACVSGSLAKSIQVSDDRYSRQKTKSLLLTIAVSWAVLSPILSELRCLQQQRIFCWQFMHQHPSTRALLSATQRWLDSGWSNLMEVRLAM